MRALLIIFLPPLAVLSVGKPVQAGINCLLTLCGWVPGVLHAFYVCSQADREKQTKKIVRAMKKDNQRTRKVAGARR